MWRNTIDVEGKKISIKSRANYICKAILAQAIDSHFAYVWVQVLHLAMNDLDVVMRHNNSCRMRIAHNDAINFFLSGRFSVYAETIGVSPEYVRDLMERGFLWPDDLLPVELNKGRVKSLMQRNTLSQILERRKLVTRDDMTALGIPTKEHKRRMRELVMEGFRLRPIEQGWRLV